MPAGSQRLQGAGARLVDLLHLGLDTRQAAKLRAAVELAARFSRFEVASRKGRLDRQRVTAYLTLRHHRTDQEIFGALFFDGRQRLLSERELFHGGSSRCTVDSRHILREALCLGAQKMILFHTHPSGSPEPSAEDIVITRALRLGADSVGLELLDHLLLSGDGRLRAIEV